MTLPELCIRRPVMTTLLTAALLVFGLIAYRALAVSELPTVDFPTISVSANLPGASPETMAAAVATPLEAQFSTISGLDSMTSTSAQGSTQITLQFSLDRDIDAAALDVQSAISAALRQLPPGMPNPPSFRKVNPADFPVFYLTLRSATLPLSTLNEYAETLLAQRLSTITGVAQVSVFGAQKFAVRIQADPDRLAARGIGIDELQRAIREGNVNTPLGTLDGSRQFFALEANGQLARAEEYRRLIVAYRNGAPVRLEEVATPVDGVENDKVASWFVDQRAVMLAVRRQSGANTVATVDAIKAVLPEFQAKLPAAVQMGVLYDRTITIRDSIHDVQLTLLLAGVLVVLVILLFLRNLSATLIPSLALPISLVGTFGAMYLLGFSLDNLSLLALTLAVGFVVDDAIVMLENIVRHLERGEPPLQAAIDGAREVSFTILSMTVSLVAVFIPVMFMHGVVGRLLHEFAVTLSVAILISGLISLTLTPMLCSRYLRPPTPESHGRLYRAFERGFDRLLAGYDQSLAAALRHPRLVLLGFAATVAASVWAYGAIPKGFLPNGDVGQIVAFTEGPPDASFQSMVERQRQVVEVVAADPNVAAFTSSVGAGGVRATANTGSLFITLKPRAERALSADEVIARLRPKLAGVVGLRVTVVNPPPIRIGGRLSAAQYQFTLQDTDLDELYRWHDAFLEGMRHSSTFADVTTDLGNRGPVLAIDVDRDKLGTLGLTFGQVEDALQSAFAARQVSTIYGAAAQYQVILELAPEFRADPDTLARLALRAADGTLVPLEAVARTRGRTQALTVGHQGQLPAVTLSFNLPPGVSLGQAVDALAALETELRPPASLTTRLQGAAQAFQDSRQGLGLLLLVAVLVVYIVLGILYESFVHPLTILSGLPSAGLGALVTLLVAGVELNLYAFVGVIMLVGIVKKNAIMMIDFALAHERRTGMAPAEAIYRAALVRFRPIMMTTLAALLGTLPIALALGAGAEVRQPLGLAVVGGLLVSQVLTLYLTPVVYLYLERVARWGTPRPLQPQPGLD